MDRRGFFKWMIAGGGVITAAIISIPVIGTILTPVLRRKEAARWEPIGSLEAFPLNEMTQAIASVPRDDWSDTLRKKSVYVLRSPKDEIIVFSRSCTDLSCPIVWDKGSNCFFCPCHGGIFSREGNPMKGPPKRPLFRYSTRIRDGLVEINLNSVPPTA